MVFLCIPSRERLLLVAALLLAPLATHAQVEQKLTASDASAGDYFGGSVSVSGDAAVVGAFSDDDGASSGSAYVFRRVDGVWVEEQKLTASDGVGEAYFGLAVSVSGDIAVVGAPGQEAAYVFEYDGATWLEAQALYASDWSEIDWFGGSVSVSGDVVAVGAEGSGGGNGSAYVFRRQGASWVEVQKLTASDASANDGFGGDVAVAGDDLVIGAYGDDEGGSMSGAAYVFHFDGVSWVEEQKLKASDVSAQALFGSAVSTSGDVIIVGARGSRAAYMFQRDGTVWVEAQKLTASNGGDDDFGTSVSASGDVAVIGAHGGEAAYVFQYYGETWVEEERITAFDGEVGDRFGVAVAVEGEVILVGATGDDDGGDGSGSAYAFTTPAPVAAEPEGISPTFDVHPPAPNPAFGHAAVAFALDAPAEVRLALHDVLGRAVAAVEAARLGAGEHRLALDVSALPAGVYVWRLTAGERTEAGRLTVAR